MKQNRIGYVCYFFLAFCFSMFSFANGGGGDAKGPQFFQLEPDLVVNLQNNGFQKTYLQVRIQILVKTSEALEKLKYHQPLIRDRLITLFGTKTRNQMGEVDERKKARQEALKMIQDTMTEVTGEPLAQEVLFTEFAVE